MSSDAFIEESRTGGWDVVFDDGHRIQGIASLSDAYALAGSSAGGMSHTAHQMADKSAIAHCPFCGSGDLVARSDGTTECIFCNRFFTIREEPEYNSVPGVPGNVTQIPDPVEEDQEVASNQLNGVPSFSPGPDLDSAPSFVMPDEQENPVVQAQGARFRSATGAKLSFFDYVKHLAFRHGSRDAVINNLTNDRTD